jgi:hypothetical protein
VVQAAEQKEGTKIGANIDTQQIAIAKENEDAHQKVGEVRPSVLELQNGACAVDRFALVPASVGDVVHPARE